MIHSFQVVAFFSFVFIPKINKTPNYFDIKTGMSSTFTKKKQRMHKNWYRLMFENKKNVPEQYTQIEAKKVKIEQSTHWFFLWLCFFSVQSIWNENHPIKWYHFVKIYTKTPYTNAHKNTHKRTKKKILLQKLTYQQNRKCCYSV